MTKVLIAIVIIIIVGVGATVFLGRTEQSNSPSQHSSVSEQATSSVPLIPQERRDNAPDFSLATYDGTVRTLADFDAPVRMINSWAVWCPFCTEELADFAEVQRRFPDRVDVIAINRAEKSTTAKEFTDDLGVSEDMAFLLDPDDSFYRSIGGIGMPETIFVAPDGTIAFHKRGPMDAQEATRIIRTILAQ